MKPPRWQWVRDLRAQPVPRRCESSMATWVEWRLRCYRVRPVRKYWWPQ